MVDQGVLLIEVPNVEAVCIAPAHRFHFAHFYNFNRDALEALGRKAGFEPVQTTTSSDGGNLTSVFRAVPRAAAAAVRRRELRARGGCRERPHVVEVLLFGVPVRGARQPAANVPRGPPRGAGCETPKQVLDKLILGSAQL